MAIALDQSLGSANGTGGGVSTVALTTGATAASASKSILVIGHFRNTVTGVSDNGPGLTWVKLGEIANGSNVMSMFEADAASGMSSGTVITATFSASNTLSPQICAASFTGVATGSTTDGGVKTATGSGTAWNPGSITTTGADALIVSASKGGAGADNTSTPAASYNELYDFGFGTGDFITFIYRIVAATGTYTASGTWSGSSTWTATACAFDAATAAASYPLKRRSDAHLLAR